MRVLADFQHSGLLHSLVMLFEGRLGGEVYRPIGTEWHTAGYWAVYSHPATVEQFLGIGGATPDGSAPLNNVYTQQNDIYHCKDITGDRTNKAITLEGFFSRRFDIVIASIPQHIEPFKRLCELHPCKPKLIYQIGNAWTVEAGIASNVLASAIIHGVPTDVNFVSYHQEFDLKVFRFNEEKPGQNITSLVNCFGVSDYFNEDWRLFLECERAFPEWKFKALGGQCRDGVADGEQAVADEIASSAFLWHTKNGGDGYGHVIHNAFAVGTPPIVKRSYYNGKMADPLFEDGKTCIVVDNLSASEIITKVLNAYSGDYTTLRRNTYDRFNEVVNFDQEEIKIRQFLSNLK